MQQFIKSNLEPTTSPSPLSKKANDFFRRRASLLTLLAATGCGPDALGPVTRPKASTAAQEMDGEEASCVIPDDHSNPLIVDWRGDHLDALSNKLKEEKLVVVSYKCKSFRILEGCNVEGGYGFMPSAIGEDVVSLENNDEISANLSQPGSKLGVGVGIGGGLKQGTSLDIAMATIGRVMTTRKTLSKDLLKGDCDGATHFIKGATVGAFAMQTRTSGEASAFVDIFGSGASASASSKKTKGKKKGELKECREFKNDTDKPPLNCGTPIRLHLKAISNEAQKPKEAAEVEKTEITEDGQTLKDCPENFVMSEGKCTKEKKAPHLCEKNDLVDCVVQCEKGQMDSCNNFGEMYRHGKGDLKKDYVKAAELFQKASNGGSVVGTNNLGYMYDHGKGVSTNDAKAAKLFQKACDGGMPKACNSIGVMHYHGEGINVNGTKAAKLFQKACDGGAAISCKNLAIMYTLGKVVDKDALKAASLFKKACNNGYSEACNNLGDMYYQGKELKKNYDKAASLFKKACDDGMAGGCHNLGVIYQGGKGREKDDNKANELYQKACSMGDENSCETLRKRGIEPRK